MRLCFWLCVFPHLLAITRLYKNHWVDSYKTLGRSGQKRHLQFYCKRLLAKVKAYILTSLLRSTARNTDVKHHIISLLIARRWLAIFKLTHWGSIKTQTAKTNITQQYCMTSLLKGATLDQYTAALLLTITDV